MDKNPSSTLIEGTGDTELSGGVSTGSGNTNKETKGGTAKITPIIVVNDVRVDSLKFNSLTKILGVQPKSGSYWYDGLSGAWGNRGGPALGFTQALRICFDLTDERYIVDANGLGSTEDQNLGTATFDLKTACATAPAASNVIFLKFPGAQLSKTFQ